MAITIQAQLSKKLPIEGVDWSSKQASMSISSECSDPSQIIAEAARLFALAEQAVDAQLSQSPAPQAALPQGLSTSAPSASPAQRPTASQPYRHSSTAQRRGPAPVTDSQLRFLDRLITQTGSSVPAILHQHQVGSLRDLSCKAAAGLIDELKGQAVPS
jgi:hypothetical protein